MKARLFALVLAILMVLSGILALYDGISNYHSSTTSETDASQQDQGMNGLPSELPALDVPGTHGLVWPRRVQSNTGDNRDFVPEPPASMLSPVPSQWGEECAVYSYRLGINIMSIPFLGGNPPPFPHSNT